MLLETEESASSLLNRISAQRLRELWIELPEQLALLEQRPVRLKSFDESAGRMAMRIAMVGHALSEDCGQIVRHFALSADHLAAALSQRPVPEADEHRGPYEAELFLNVVGAFGGDDAYRLCAGLRADQLRWPEHAAHVAQAGYLSQLLRYFAGMPLDPAVMQEIAQRCASARASREDRRFLQPSLAGMIAVVEGDERAWRLALAQLVEAHAEEAAHGDLQLQVEGLVCLRALMLARLGLDAGLDCDIDSPYLPLYLYDQD